MCNHFDANKWEKVTKPAFAFQRISPELNETSGVGIGISTVSKLAQALDGWLVFEIDPKSNRVSSILTVEVSVR